ncbi:MAG: hypothetical protein WAV21_01950 [Minisyncoccia bacterium]
MHHETDFKWLAAECAKTDSFAELVSLALVQLRKFPNGAGVVCGPISTGGRGVEQNLKIFSGSIEALKLQNFDIFSQIPYEEKIFAFRRRWQDADPSRAGQYYMPILEEFYHPLFHTGLIKKAWFIPGWESSFGATWEREQLTSLGAEIIDLDENWVEKILAAA